MPEQAVSTIETAIVEMDKFMGRVHVGDEVHLCRRLVDVMYDETAIAMLNNDDEVVGYLNRDVAKDLILPYIKRGVKFKCVVTEGPNGDGDVPIEMRPLLLEWRKQEANPITSVSGVGPVFGKAFKAVGINTDADLLRRVEEVGVEKIWEEIKQSDQGMRLRY